MGLKASNVPREAGSPKKYGNEFRDALLAKIGTKPPDGLARRDCPALARELKASENTVWKCLSKEGIHLERQGTRRVSAVPEFAEKAADIAGPASIRPGTPP